MATMKDMKNRFGRKQKQPVPKPRRSSRLVDRLRDDRIAHTEDKTAKDVPEPAESIPRKFMRPGGRYEACTTDGDRDAILLFGKYKKDRKKVSDLAWEDNGYLRWICTEHRDEIAKGEPGFKPELVEIIKEWIGRAERG